MKQWRQGAGHTSSPVYPEPCQLSPARTSRSRDEEPDWGLSHSPSESPQGHADWAPRAGVFLQHPGQPPPTPPRGLGPWPRGTAALRPGCQSGEAVHTMALKVFQLTRGAGRLGPAGRLLGTRTDRAPMGQGRGTGDMSRAEREDQGAVRRRRHEEAEVTAASALTPGG